MGRLNNKVAIITGGASGMGAAAARAFVREGAQARRSRSSTYRRWYAPRFTARASWTSSTTTPAAGDGRRPAPSGQEAGISGRTHEMTEQAWDDTVNLNLRAVWLGMKYALPRLIDNGGGSIVTTASVSAYMGMPGQAAYGAGKGAVVQLTRIVAVE